MIYYILVDKQEEILEWDQAGFYLLAPPLQLCVCQLGHMSERFYSLPAQALQEMSIQTHEPVGCGM